MSLTIITCSHQGFSWAREAISLYEKRIARFEKIQSIVIKPHKVQRPIAEMMLLDIAQIESKIPKQSTVYLCHERGKHYTSNAFSELLQKDKITAPNITFVIGPAYGLSPDILEKYRQISLSHMTLQHEMAHMLLCEQIYRSITLALNHPYHR
ncbi:23S rRNA (pseudouridine(1915)-N(3))-methyltransferase RlmH [Candidatus Synchoanobacter obligatus]|uniref:Ribosomal RNA large subunit methyltransferase H n=1 Tax=Candidatus Synchoanobacter obligatus TaxID=2919597 RepID=A0ABT1L3I3_9GAMM|nr:23S rRNA (pseudouridine(1915)-N(3))-methyltransferase RlmH [Candidatus Synchoanobacter obligatus]MCP8351777.1 23S rRNA (pseudouridine(1915)-N(3))-methyltransferase RlmH [Candidatus Synchoanobacter obligatus]